MNPVKLAHVARRQGEIVFFRVVLDGAAKHHRALLQHHNVGTFKQAIFKFEIIEKVVPKVVLGKNFGVAKNDESVLSSSEGDIQSS